MNTYSFAVYVGPTQVASMAEDFRVAGVVVTTEGTERVFVLEDGATPEDARAMFLAMLRATYGHAFCLAPRDVKFVKQVTN